MKPDERRLAWFVFAAALLLDLAFRSCYFNFDGVACAIAVETSDFKHLVHGNHLAYGVLAWLFDRVWRLLGYRGEALWTLQILDGLLGAAGAAVFASLLRRSGRSERESFLGAAALAVSQAWWFWSLEAQVYMLGALFAALAAREALAERPRPGRVGLWAACAALGHVGHLMAVPALVWRLRGRSRGAAASFFKVLAGALAAAYLAAGLLAARPQGLEDLRLWLLGSAALGVDRAFSWHAAPLGAALTAWSGMTLRVFCDFAGQTGAARAAGAALAALPLLAAARGALRLDRARRFWLLWLAGYAALYLTWEPFTVVYRVSDLLALWALALAGLEGYSPRVRTAALAAWIAAAAAFNYATLIRPQAEPASNADLVEARWIGARAPENAWLIAEGRAQVYVPYFARRKPLNLRYLPDAPALEAKLDALSALGEPVYVTDRALARSGRGAALARYGLEVASAGDGLTLYRVRRGASRAAGAGKSRRPPPRPGTVRKESGPSAAPAP